MNEGYLQYFVQYVIKLFLIISPLVVIALFVSMTSMDTLKGRMRTAKVGSIVGYVAMMFFALTGKKIFEFLGVTMGAFYIAGGIIIFSMGMYMINYDDGEQSTNDGASGEGGSKKKKVDVSVTPLGIPIICGPCCITGVIAQQSQAVGFAQSIVGLAAVTVVGVSVYAMLVLSARGTKWLTPSVLRLSCKLSGILLAALAVQMVITGMRNSDLKILQSFEEVERASSHSR
jgi:multiple antibiotic resistance protein